MQTPPLDENWKQVKKLFRASFSSSFHYAIATVDDAGAPHVTPIGSLILGRTGKGIYFERFTRALPLSAQTHARVCVLAVNSNRWFWLKSLLAGRFASPPAVRLHGTLGKVRPATDTERRLWQKRVARMRFTRGHALMWRGMEQVREIEFSHIEPVNTGTMTRDNWSLAPGDTHTAV